MPKILLDEGDYHLEYDDYHDQLDNETRHLSHPDTTMTFREYMDIDWQWDGDSTKEPKTDLVTGTLFDQEYMVHVMIKRIRQPCRDTFEREYKLVTGHLKPHPNLVYYYPVTDQYRLLCMPRYTGSCYDLVAHGGIKFAHWAVNVYKQMLQGVGHCHAAGVCHRDVKLENFLVDPLVMAPEPFSEDRCLIRLCDFEFAQQPADKELLKDFPGSLYYASPEVVKGQPYDGFKSDVWSLGVCLYVMMFRGYPFGAGTDVQTAKLVAAAHLEFPRGHQYDGALIHRLRWLLTKSANTRPTVPEIIEREHQLSLESDEESS